MTTVYLDILFYVHPFKRQDDFQLAIISNILLIYIFSLDIAIQLRDNDDNDDDDDTDICKKTIGLSINLFKATFITADLTVTMLVITMCLLLL